jgi:hypothetical protein
VTIIAASVVLGSYADPTVAQEVGTRPSAVRDIDSDILTSREQKLLNDGIIRGLAWLATQQRADGSFQTRDVGQPAITSLCILAFLARGHLPGEGRYGADLNRAIEYVLSCQQPDGVFAKVAPTMPTAKLNASHTSNYNHTISGLMLAEVYGMTRGDLNRRIKPALEKAIAYASQRLPQPKRLSVDEGGWRYRTSFPRNDSDLSVTSWHLMFLRSCKNAGFQVPNHLVDEALQYVGRLYHPNPGTFVYSANTPSITRAMAGAGILSFTLGGRHGDERTERAGQFLLRHPFHEYNVPDFEGERYFYSAFYSSLAMFQLGGRYWREFYPVLERTLVGNQRRDGSWDTDCREVDAVFGRAYTTALVILALSPPTQLLPIFQR